MSNPAPAGQNSTPPNATTAPPAANRTSAAQPANRSSQNKVLWSTTLGLVFLAGAYAARDPLSHLQAISSGAAKCRWVAARAYERALEYTQDRARDSQDLALADSPWASQAAAFPTAKLEPLNYSKPRTTSARRLQPAEPVQSVRPAIVHAAEKPETQLVPAAARTVEIPDSIRRPQMETDSNHIVAARPPSLLGQLEPVLLSQDVAEQMVLQKVRPSYPEQALKAGLQGAVVLQAWISADGSVRDLKLVHGSLLLGQAAYRAVKQWHYKPYVLDGRAVEAQTFVTVNFTLPQQSLLLPSR
jgi:TonB family protein